MKIFIALMLSGTFAMASDVSCTVVLPNGSPAEGVQVAVVAPYARVNLKRAKMVSSQGTVFKVTGANGRFDFYGIDKAETVIALNQNGFAEVAFKDLTNGSKIVLQPWGAVEGVFRVGAEVGTNRQVRLDADLSVNSVYRFTPISLDWEAFRDTTDQSGKFTFTYVPPGTWRVMGGAGEWFGDTVTVKAGETNHITTGGTGRPLVAKLLIPKNVARLNQAPPPPVGYYRRFLESETNGGDFYDVEAYLSGADHRLHLSRMASDGKIRIEDVTPGRWWLSGSILKLPGKGGKAATFAAFGKEVIIPEIPGGRSDEPLDLGDLKPIMVHSPQVGEDAPPLAVKTTDGGTFNLAEHRGQYVLLDFEPTTGSWNIKTNAGVEAAGQSYGGNDKLAILTLCVPPPPSYMFNPERTPQPKWSVAHLEMLPHPELTFIQAGFGLNCDYGIRLDPNLPAVFLIGPDGKFVRTHLQTDDIDAAIGQFLVKK